MTAHVVIGANFGDEGKGLMVDHLTRMLQPTPLVVRFNGGAQAGHTVQHGKRRHVFHHIGSGTLAGGATLLSRVFVANPFLFNPEYEALQGLGATPVVTIDPRAPLTTPFDMMLNQIAEEVRGTARHGSCGLGFNETLKRAELQPVLTTTVADMLSEESLRIKLSVIRDYYVPERLHFLFPDLAVSEEWQKRIKNRAIIDAYMDSVALLRSRVTIQEDADVMHRHDGPVVFEGAQGLLLDEDHRFFPHVTHSHTGMHNVRLLAADAGISIGGRVNYMTRAYMTRHGAGPFPSEITGLAYADATNVPNPWQGALRFGAIDLDLMREAITKDRRTEAAGIVVTCVDQVGSKAAVRVDGENRWIATSELFDVIEKATGLPVTHFSTGPTSADVRVVSEALIAA